MNSFHYPYLDQAALSTECPPSRAISIFSLSQYPSTVGTIVSKHGTLFWHTHTHITVGTILRMDASRGRSVPGLCVQVGHYSLNAQRGFESRKQYWHALMDSPHFPGK